MTNTSATPRQRRVVALLTALAVMFGTVLVSVAAAPAASASVATTEATFLSKLNGARSTRGVHRLVARADLVAVARAQSQRMASRNTLYHNPNLTRDVRNWRWVGENVGYGPYATTIHNAFMNSPAHKANILDRDYTEVGVGVVISGGRVWVTQVFRRPASTAGVEGTKLSVPGSTTWVTLRLGSKGYWVKRVQQRLGVRQTGYYGYVTRRAVMRFQASKGWRPIGVVGPGTRRALGI